MSAPLLVTPVEVWEIAFPPNANGPDDQINETLIETAQLRYLKPVLGPLYDTLGESRQESFVTQFLKKPLAYYVKSLALSLMSASVGSLGILEGKTDYAAPVSIRQLHLLRKEARHQADLLLEQSIEYIEANPTLFPEYDPHRNIRHKIRMQGGLVLKAVSKS